MDIEKLKSVLIRARKCAHAAGFEAEARHDDIEGEYYMDGVQYEIINEVDEMIADIDSLLREIEGT